MKYLTILVLAPALVIIFFWTVIKTLLYFLEVGHAEFVLTHKDYERELTSKAQEATIPTLLLAVALWVLLILKFIF